MHLTNEKILNSTPKSRLYRLHDGNGLFLEVEPKGRKHWLFCYEQEEGRLERLFLGDLDTTSINKARKIGAACRTLILSGLKITNPARDCGTTNVAQDLTLQSVSIEWHTFKRIHWNSKHADKILSRLEHRVFPVLGHLKISEVRTPHIIKLLIDVEKSTGSEVAKRVRLYLTDIFRYACQFEYTTTNPARETTGIIKTPNNQYAAFKPYQLPDFFARLESYELRAYEITTLAIRLTMHTFVRNSELRLAKWSEIDWQEKLWEIPAERMKMKKPHVVPLSQQSIKILKKLLLISGDLPIIFPMKHKPGKSISDVSSNQALRKMGYDTKTEHTTHGFRTIASSVLNESGLWNPDAIERQLAHEEKNDVRAAYNRAEYIEERIKMMQWYSDYLENVELGKIIPTKIKFDGIS